MSKLQILALVLPLFALAYATTLVDGQRFAPGYCPTVTAQENFDKTKFFGNWIEVEKTPSIFDLMMRCLVVDYSDDQDNTVNVVVRGVSLAGLPLTVNGDGLLQDVHRSGFYSIRYGFGVPFQGTLTTIIDTDYDDYAVVYSCTNSLLSGVFHSEYIWVLSRSGKISNPTRQNIYEKLDKLQINRSGLTMSDRSTCPTNASTVARESDKDLAGSQSGGSSQPIGSAAAGSPDSSASTSSPSANLEKASEVTQKSVVVPLLYDLPSPASSSSVGNSKSGQKASPPSPVENKVPQLPYAPVSQKQQQQQPGSKPSAGSPSAAAGSPSGSPASQAASPAGGQQAAASSPASSQTQAAPAAPQVANKPASGSGQPDKPSLINKIQPKQKEQQQ